MSLATSMSSRLATLPIDILAIFSAFLYAKSLGQLHSCGDKLLNAKLTQFGGASTLRYHFGHPNNFGSRGTELRGHFSSVPLDFPLEGVAYTSTTLSNCVQRSFELINRFAKLKVLSIYSYRTFNPAHVVPPLVDYFTNDVMKALPSTLEVIEFRFAGSIQSFMAPIPVIVKSQDQRRAIVSNTEYGRLSSALASGEAIKEPWMPIKQIFPNLKTFSIWSDWQDFPVGSAASRSVQYLRKELLYVLPSSLEHLDVDFLTITTFRDKVPNLDLPALQTFTSVPHESQLASTMFSNLPPTLIRLIIPEASFQTAHLLALPATLLFLQIKDFEGISFLERDPLPLPPQITSLATNTSAFWSPQLVQKLPVTLEVFKLRRCFVEDLPKFASLLARSVVFEYLSQSRATAPFKIEALAAMNTVNMQQFRITMSPSFRTSMADHAPIWASLRTLELLGSHISESCLLALPQSLVLLDVASIRSTGILLPQTTIIVDIEAVTTSIRAWCRQHLPRLEAIPPVTCISLTHVPSSAQDVSIDHLTVSLQLLPNLTRLRHLANPKVSAKGAGYNFPACLTELDWTGSSYGITSQMLGNMPSTVTSYTGHWVTFRKVETYDFSTKKEVLSMTFPEDLAAVQDGWTHIKLLGSARVLYLGDPPLVKLQALPPKLTQLTLRGTGHPSLALTPNHQTNMFAGLSMYFDPKLIAKWPKSLKRVKFVSGALVQYPLHLLPTTITELEFENHFVNTEVLKQFAHLSNLRVLEVRDGLRMSDEDVGLLPPSLTSLHLGTSTLSPSALPNFPSSLIDVTLGTNSHGLTAQVILDACAAKRNG